MKQLFSSFLFVNFKQFAHVIKKIPFIQASTLRRLGARQASHGDVADVAVSEHGKRPTATSLTSFVSPDLAGVST